MFSLWVTLQITPSGREGFLTAIEANAHDSVRDEDGCFRFDVVELGSGTNRFAFYEIYKDEAAFEDEHKKASHYLIYKEAARRVVVPGSQTNVSGHLINTFGSPAPG